MKTRNTSFMAGLLILGILGASDSIASANIENRISGANAAKIARIKEINHININGEIDINEIGSNNIAIRNIIRRDILDDHIDAGIARIAA